MEQNESEVPWAILEEKRLENTWNSSIYIFFNPELLIKFKDSRQGIRAAALPLSEGENKWSLKETVGASVLTRTHPFSPGGRYERPTKQTYPWCRPHQACTRSSAKEPLLMVDAGCRFHLSSVSLSEMILFFWRESCPPWPPVSLSLIKITNMLWLQHLSPTVSLGSEERRASDGYKLISNQLQRRWRSVCWFWTKNVPVLCGAHQAWTFGLVMQGEFVLHQHEQHQIWSCLWYDCS